MDTDQYYVEGILFKKGAKGLWKDWKKRWFELHPARQEEEESDSGTCDLTARRGRIYYWQSEAPPNKIEDAKGFIDLAGARLVEKPPEKNSASWYFFDITANSVEDGKRGERTYQLASATQLELEKWLSVLSALLATPPAPVRPLFPRGIVKAAGYLLKLGVARSWTRRWFEVHIPEAPDRSMAKLYMWKDSSLRHKAGEVIDITGGTMLEVVEKESVGWHRFCIGQKHSRGKRAPETLAAPTATDRARWVEALYAAFAHNEHVHMLATTAGINESYDSEDQDCTTKSTLSTENSCEDSDCSSVDRRSRKRSAKGPKDILFPRPTTTAGESRAPVARPLLPVLTRSATTDGTGKRSGVVSPTATRTMSGAFPRALPKGSPLKGPSSAENLDDIASSAPLGSLPLTDDDGHAIMLNAITPPFDRSSLYSPPQYSPPMPATAIAAAAAEPAPLERGASGGDIASSPGTPVCVLDKSSEHMQLFDMAVTESQGNTPSPPPAAAAQIPPAPAPAAASQPPVPSRRESVAAESGDGTGRSSPSERERRKRTKSRTDAMTNKLRRLSIPEHGHGDGEPKEKPGSPLAKGDAGSDAGSGSTSTTTTTSGDNRDRERRKRKRGERKDNDKAKTKRRKDKTKAPAAASDAPASADGGSVVPPLPMSPAQVDEPGGEWVTIEKKRAMSEAALGSKLVAAKSRMDKMLNELTETLKSDMSSERSDDSEYSIARGSRSSKGDPVSPLILTERPADVRRTVMAWAKTLLVLQVKDLKKHPTAIEDIVENAVKYCEDVKLEHRELLRKFIHIVTPVARLVAAHRNNDDDGKAILSALESVPPPPAAKHPPLARSSKPFFSTSLRNLLPRWMGGSGQHEKPADKARSPLNPASGASTPTSTRSITPTATSTPPQTTNSSTASLPISRGGDFPSPFKATPHLLTKAQSSTDVVARHVGRGDVLNASMPILASSPPREQRLCQCRICEQMIEQTFFTEHSRLCAIAHKCDINQFSCDIRITKAISNIRDAISKEEEPSPYNTRVLGWAQWLLSLPHEDIRSVSQCEAILESIEAAMEKMDPPQPPSRRTSRGEFSPPFTPPATTTPPTSAPGTPAGSRGPSPVRPPRTVVPAETPALPRKTLQPPGPTKSEGPPSTPSSPVRPLSTPGQAFGTVEDSKSPSGTPTSAKGLTGMEVSAASYSFYVQLKKMAEDKLASLKERQMVDSIASASESGGIETAPVVPHIEDFEILKAISRGAYGSVHLARKRATGDLFAVKILKKEDIIRKNLVGSIFAERNIMALTRNPFIVKLFYSFHSHNHLYLVMEYLPGGDLGHLLEQFGRFTEDMARILIAEITLALQYLHSKGIIHRDLKPDNILLSAEGHIKLTDFGLSQIGVADELGDGEAADDEDEPRSSRGPAYRLQGQFQQEENVPIPGAINGVIGTPDYLSPEILTGMSHGPAADWWAVGVLLYEFIMGVPPFNDETVDAIFDNIINVKIPWALEFEEGLVEVPPVARSLLEGLLRADPNERLGSGPLGVDNIKAHAFFAGVDWDHLEDRKSMLSFKFETELDTSYFQSEHRPSTAPHVGSMALQAPPVGPRKKSSGGGGDAPVELQPFYDYFSNFSYKNLGELESRNTEELSKTQLSISSMKSPPASARGNESDDISSADDQPLAGEEFTMV